MKILLIPLLIVFSPVVILFFVLRHLNKAQEISISLKIALGLVFVALGMAATFFAVITSLAGISDEGISCGTGAIVFIPIGIIANLIGIPILLISNKGRQKKTFQIN